MKLLIITQKVDRNDPVLGFFHRWIAEFSKHVESLVVICLEKGEYDLPKNVRVLSLGKEAGKSRLKYIARFYLYIWKERRNYDAVFAHMNSIYVILGAPIWRACGKKIALWHAHATIDTKASIATRLSDLVLTSTTGGFPRDIKKRRVLGQGIDTDFFSPVKHAENEKLEIVSIGRISPSKDIDTILDACASLKNIDYRLQIIGSAGTEDQAAYFEDMKKKVVRLDLSDKVFFLGSKSQDDILPYLEKADIFVNAGLTGSLDKALLEPLACGVITISCNTAFKSISAELAPFIFAPRDPAGLAETIRKVSAMTFEERTEIGKKLRNIVVRDHGLASFAGKVVKAIESI